MDVARSTKGVRYDPKSDFSLKSSCFGPILLVEVVSDTKYESDRSRMLVQAVPVCRVAGALCKPDERPLITCGYVNKDLVLEVYFVFINEAPRPGAIFKPVSVLYTSGCIFIIGRSSYTIPPGTFRIQVML